MTTARARLSTRNPQAYGFAVTLLGALFFFPDALVVRLIDTDTMTIAVWRGIAAAVTTFAGLAIFGRASLPNWRDLLRWPSLAMIFLQGIGSVFFLASLGQTSAANALLILATAPFIAALMSWAILRERIDTPTWGAIFTVFAGVGIIGAGSLGGGHLSGDLFALANAVVIAAYYVVIRMAPPGNLMPAIAIGYLLTSAIAYPFAPMAPLDLEQAALIAISGGVILAGGCALLQIGPRYLPAAEVSMITMLEIIAGPVLVWLFIGEHPGLTTLIGGGVILIAITAHSLLKLAQSQRGQPA